MIGTIIHQTQPTSTSCTSACLAMIIGAPVAEVVDEFHDAYMRCEKEPHEFLAEKGIIVRRCFVGEAIEWDKVYLVAVPSINFETVMHNVVVDTRNDKVLVFDPAQGRPNRRYYAHIDPRLNYHPILNPYIGTLFQDGAVPFFGHVAELEIDPYAPEVK